MNNLSSYCAKKELLTKIYLYSFGKWKELEKECGSKLLVTTGLINFGSCDTNTGKCNDDYLHKHMNVLKDSGKVKDLFLFSKNKNNCTN